jgi:hypothetical protein
LGPQTLRQSAVFLDRQNPRPTVQEKPRERTQARPNLQYPIARLQFRRPDDPTELIPVMQKILTQ